MSTIIYKQVISAIHYTLNGFEKCFEVGKNCQAIQEKYKNYGDRGAIYFTVFENDVPIAEFLKEKLDAIFYKGLPPTKKQEITINIKE